MSIKKIRLRFLFVLVTLSWGCEAHREVAIEKVDRLPASKNDLPEKILPEKTALRLADFAGTYRIVKGSDKDCPDGVFSVQDQKSLSVGAEYTIEDVGQGPKAIPPHPQFDCSVRREAKVEGRTLREKKTEICGKNFRLTRWMTLSQTRTKKSIQLKMEIRTDTVENRSKKKSYKKNCLYEKAFKSSSTSR